MSYTTATSHEGGWPEGRVAQMEKSLEELTRQTTALKCHTRELEMQLQASLASTHTGSLLWRVPDVPPEEARCNRGEDHQYLQSSVLHGEVSIAVEFVTCLKL